jgi:hypothetical protein
MEVSACVIRLLKVVKEDTLLASEFDAVFPLGPRQGRRKRIQGMVKLGIHATLVVDGSPWGIHQDRRHAGDSGVGVVQKRRESGGCCAGIGRETRGVNMLDGESAAQKQGGTQRPVKLQAPIVDAGDVVIAVIKLPIP